MKIIIVGAGISGLSTYLHLRKHLSPSHTITIYESHKPRSSSLPTTATPAELNLENLSASTTLVGGGLGVSPNGMRVLYDLDPELHDAVVAQGFPAEHFIFKGANGWTLGKQKTSDRSVRKTGKEEFCVSSSRHGLWEALLKSVGEGIIQYKKVLGIVRNENQKKIFVKLVDAEGNEENDVADLVIGADGIRSVVRTALFGDGDKFKPVYTGQSGVGGFLKEPIPAFVADNKAMIFTFGGNGFFGYSSSGPTDAKSLMWWSTFETSSLPAKQAIDTDAIKEALRKRHQHWNDPIIQNIIQKAEVQSIYPTYVLDIDNMPNWGELGMVLVGDAAHAMDPTTGQGASQALEDSQTLSLLLAECLKRGEHGELDGSEAISLALKLYYEIRNPRVREIVERGKKIAGNKANVGVVMEYFMYFFLWLLNRFPAVGKFFGACLHKIRY
ncbi:hypothetical protein B0J11DRAFT_425122 [Dendryphion nanum]|uniref:FAD-binding domain-containing protein n=1 Tax=Dendryphion nanum TaxID=256645 RepID=A0A9P9EDB6_9PLEO|nr:hypothetical protein B0J11DRAFT_425122 [Dendryphion nanum]